MSRQPGYLRRARQNIKPNQGRPWDGKPRVRRFLRSGQPGYLKNLIRKEQLMSRRILFTALCIVSLCILPLAGMAGMNSLSDDQLSEVVGQAGFTINPGTISLNSGDGSACFGDLGSLNFLAKRGIISLSDVTLLGSITFHDPVTIDTDLPQGGIGAPGFDIRTGDMSIDIDRYSVGAITPGPVPGTEPSLGSLEIRNMHVSVTGSIRISTH
jgi:hypothetical protein